MPASPGLFSFATPTSWAVLPPRPTGVSNTSAISQTSSPGGPPSTCFAFDSFRLFVTSTGIPCGGRVIRWSADKGGEYTSEAFKQYCLEMGITQEFAPNTSQQNGVSERVGRTLCSMVRCVLVNSGFPPKLWGKLMLTAAYLCNRMPHFGLDMETPFKRLYGKEANLSHLKISALELSPTSRMPRGWNPSP